MYSFSTKKKGAICKYLGSCGFYVIVKATVSEVHMEVVLK